VSGRVLQVGDLVGDLRRLGVAPGDVVMVHASLRAIGPVAGGATSVVAALDAAVGGGGTLLMVLGAADDWAWVNERCESERPALLGAAEPFDAWNTPAEADVGALAEVFRTAHGTLVSDHPEGRFAARGRMAASLVADPPWDDYYGFGSALHRLVELGGKVLRLGAGRDTVTLTHFAEYVADVSDKRRVRRHRRVSTPEGPVIRVMECLDDSHGIADWDGDGDYFVAILGAFLEGRSAASGLVGKARAESFDAADYVRFAADWMTANLRPSAP
jgi:aminoglycoside N3'-acetyltransferase